MTLVAVPTREEGFSLLEVLVAFVILAAVSTLSFSAFSRPKIPSTPEAMGREVARMFQNARLRAIGSRSTVETVFDMAERRIHLSEGSFVMRLPDGMQLRLRTGQQLIETTERGSIAFYSDGSSSGGHVKIEMKGLPNVFVEVPWLTGTARLTRAQSR